MQISHLKLDANADALCERAIIPAVRHTVKCQNVAHAQFVVHLCIRGIHE